MEDNIPKKRRIRTIDERIQSLSLRIERKEEFIKRQQCQHVQMQKELVRLKGLKTKQHLKELDELCKARNIDLETIIANVDMFIDTH